jgi:hypothetical protein
METIVVVSSLTFFELLQDLGRRAHTTIACQLKSSIALPGLGKQNEHPNSGDTKNNV